MRICFVAYFKDEGGRGDMGTRSVARHLADCVSKRHEVLKVDIRDIGSWKKAKDFRPDIIHFVFAPTTMGFVAARIFSLYCRRGARVVMSAPNPTLSCRRLVRHLKPDVMLIQSEESEKFFTCLGFNTRFLPGGVDTARFVPVSAGEKHELRKKYGIDADKYVILHVGPVIRRRNIETLMDLQSGDSQVLVVGRRPFDSRFLAEMRAEGALLITENVERIEEIYELSDCYVFPTDPENRGASIEMPLSVMEAMACNLPVISTEFGALTRIFHDGIKNLSSNPSEQLSSGRRRGLFFYKFNNKEELKEYIEKVKNEKPDAIKTREIAALVSWENIADNLNRIYCEK